MVAQVKLFEKTHILTPAIKAVLNTLKLHAKRYFAGVCWLKREEIAKKAKVSLASVKRAIKALKEVGILTVHPHIHTKRGGQAHNVYVINPLFKPENEPLKNPKHLQRQRFVSLSKSPIQTLIQTLILNLKTFR